MFGEFSQNFLYTVPNFAPIMEKEFSWFVHFFAVTARLPRENVFQRKYTSDDEISSLFLNMDMVLRNSTLGGFTYIYQSL